MEKLGSSVPCAPSVKSDHSKDTPPDLHEDVESLTSSDCGCPSSLSASSASAGQVLCDVCRHLQTAVKTCLACMDSFCETDARDHMQGHQLMDLQCELQDRNLGVIKSPQSTSSESVVREDVPPPGQIEITEVRPDSISLCWSPPEGALGYHKFILSWRGGPKEQSILVKGLAAKMTQLIPGVMYRFFLATLSEDGHQSQWVERSVHTEVPAPEDLTVDLRSLTAFLKWTKPKGVDQISYILELNRDQKCIQTIYRDSPGDSPDYTITDLRPGDYTINVSTLLRNGRQSKPTIQMFEAEYSSNQIALNWTRVLADHYSLSLQHAIFCSQREGLLISAHRLTQS